MEKQGYHNNCNLEKAAKLKEYIVIIGTGL